MFNNKTDFNSILCILELGSLIVMLIDAHWHSEPVNSSAMPSMLMFID